MLPKAQADFNNALNSIKGSIFSNLMCHNIGRIITYYPDKQAADIELMQIKEFNNAQYPNAVICDVPLIIYGTENAHITLPDLTGTICLLFTLDRNIDAFMETGESYVPPTSRMHNITDCIAITTFSTLNNPIQNYDDTAISIIHNKIIDEVIYNSVIKNYADSILLKYNKDNDGTPTYSQIQLKDKINIQNTTRNLATLINTLIVHIRDLTITQGVVSDASKADLDADITAFGELLE